MSTRRDFIKQFSAVAGLGVAASMGLGLSPARVQAALTGSWHMPDETHPQQRAFVAFGAQQAVWAEFTADVQNAIGLIASTIAQYQPVTVLCRAEERYLAEEKCGSYNTSFLVTALDDIWIRDTGANFVIDGLGGLGAVDFNFNGWGNKQIHANDTLVANQISYDASATYIRSMLTGEGGGIEVDGKGTAIMCESSWINDNRNPGMSKAQIEVEMMANLGLRKIIWLPGIKGKDITDAHVDFYARFVKPGVVVANIDNNPASYDYAVTRAHLEILNRATDADGNPLQVHLLPPPTAAKCRQTKFNQNNKDFAAGYINYFPINGAIIAPEFGDAEADQHCFDLLTQLYPQHRIVQINIDAVASGGGGIHCVTNNQPRV
ncbi:MAG: agmatine deiminase family protein [Pseudomonas sp.]